MNVVVEAGPSHRRKDLDMGESEGDESGDEVEDRLEDELDGMYVLSAN